MIGYLLSKPRHHIEAFCFALQDDIPFLIWLARFSGEPFSVPGSAKEDSNDHLVIFQFRESLYKSLLKLLKVAANL